MWQKMVLVAVVGGITQAAWALSCVPTPLFTARHTAKVYPSSVFWLQSSRNVAPSSLRLSHTNGQHPATHTLQQGPILAASTLQQLKPKQPLQAGQRYVIASQRPVNAVETSLTELANTFEVSAAPTLPTLAWRQPPVLTQVNYGKGSWGASGSLEWTLASTVAADSYLVLVTMARNPEFAQAQAYLLQPEAVKGGDTISLGHSICQSAAESFHFVPSETLWATFDLIGHDGSVLKWAGLPVRLGLQDGLREQ